MDSFLTLGRFARPGTVLRRVVLGGRAPAGDAEIRARCLAGARSVLADRHSAVSRQRRIGVRGVQ
jgi:hypothetical protein